jgi:hypothetical protein
MGSATGEQRFRRAQEMVPGRAICKALRQVDVQPQAFLGKVAGCSSYVSSSGAGNYSPSSGIAPTFIIDPGN